jgi:tryptophanyl-tRNA synthetase
VTDSGSEVRFDPAEKPGVSNLLQILAATTDREILEVEAEYAGSGYGALKGAVADAVVEFVRPLQARYQELEHDPGEVDRIIAAGAARATQISAPVMERVRRATGLLSRASS